MAGRNGKGPAKLISKVTPSVRRPQMLFESDMNKAMLALVSIVQTDSFNPVSFPVIPDLSAEGERIHVLGRRYVR